MTGKPPPYARRVNREEHELRVYLGFETAWRYARIDADSGRRRQFVMEPGTVYDLHLVAGHPVLLIALDSVTGAEVTAAARDLLVAGAEHVAAVSPLGTYRMFAATRAAA